MTLQPFTTLDSEWNDSLTGDFLWTKTNLGEAITETMTPLSWSVAQFTFRDLAYLPGLPALGNICGYPYFNITGLATALHTVGFTRNSTLDRMEDLLNIRLPDDVEIPLIPYPRRRFFSILYSFATLFRHFNHATKDAPDYLASNREWFEQTHQRIAQVQAPIDLVDLWQNEIQAHIKRGFWIVLGYANASAASTFGLRRKLLPLVGPEDANTLLANLNDDTAPLASLGPVVGLSRVARGEMTREAYLEQFGHRGPNEFEISHPRPVENPTWVEHELSRLNEEAINVQDMLDKQKISFSAAWMRYEKAYPNRVKAMQRKLAHSRNLARLREDVRSEYVRDRWLTRLFAIHAGELTGIGCDIFFLTLDEMLTLLSGNQAVTNKISARKARYQSLKTLPPFPTIIRGRFDPFKWTVDPQRRNDFFDATSSITKEPTSIISGSPGSAGKVEGIVRVINDPKNGDQLQQSEILVAVQTDIAWTLLFPRAAAIVTDVGAMLSHAAIVARELGIPAVVGCGDATTRLKTGDRVCVDGARGMVQILER